MLAETSRFKTAKLSILSGGLRFEADAATGDHLYDRRIDPAERQDRADTRPSEAAALSAQLFATLGDPCTLPEGASLAEQGILWQSGARLSEIQGPAQFGLYPPDAPGCPAAPPLDLDGDTRARLEALGYVQPEGAGEAEKPEGAAAPGLDAGQGSVKEEAPGR